MPYKQSVTFVSVALLMHLSQLAARAQQILLDSTFSNALEVSSIVTKDNRLILIPEKCKSLYVCNLSGARQTIQRIDDNNIHGDEVEIEGATLYSNGMLLADERVGRILYIDSSTGIASVVDSDYDLSGDIGNMGMEGIAVDESRDLCYILKESNGNGESIMRVFKIANGKSLPVLTFLKNIRLPQPSKNWRLTDLVYNPVDDYVYMLKSQKGSYEIVRISSKLMEKVSNDDLIQYQPYKNLTNLVNSFENAGFNTNIEGIALTNDSFFVVSDNATSPFAICSESGEGKTLLLRIAF
nr:esterase-like activity of phytase family protein [uncultured Dyadobacter sp.]